MKTLRIFSVAIVAVTFLLGSCGKYPEGPSVSLRTKKARIDGKWDIVKVVDDEGDESDPNLFDSNVVFEMTAAGDITVRDNDDDKIGEGSWAFIDSKEQIEITIELDGWPDYDDIYQIIKLKDDEMWLTHINDYDENNAYYGGYKVYKSID